MQPILTHAQFEPLLGERFFVTVAEGKSLEIELIQVQSLPAHPDRSGRVPDRQPFSLLFRGPLATLLPQCIYLLEQAALGQVEIFLVPIGPDQTGHRYEAVFN